MSFFGLFGGKKATLDDELFNLKFASKSLKKESTKSMKNMEIAKKKAADCMKKKDMESAQIYASNFIMHKNTSVNYLRLSVRLEAISAKLDTAIKMQQVTGQMATITKSMDKVMKSMNLEKISSIMDEFEKCMFDSEVQAGVVNKTMDGTTTGATDQSEIEAAMSQIAEENALDLGEALPSVAGMGAARVEEKPVGEGEDDDLMRRLAQLRAPTGNP